ncbi:hypothetical protein BOS5A_211238 [Bosea sp. EC-HK365B]|nr:hypothetical protein BOSE21B_50454 [Bosea sp. 21B]CAD5301035.1 hypothetical protein BOSE7B_90238 [Bosea sp. 7B]VVT60447.1 hypothetical protein BOS5A_211238 [Bosea sp. EC-HK365B]VXB61858.1 hypothetical protein BOSE127_140181 [Bosea sp. 127]
MQVSEWGWPSDGAVDAYADTAGSERYKSVPHKSCL